MDHPLPFANYDFINHAFFPLDIDDMEEALSSISDDFSSATVSSVMDELKITPAFQVDLTTLARGFNVTANALKLLPRETLSVFCEHHKAIEDLDTETYNLIMPAFFAGYDAYNKGRIHDDNLEPPAPAIDPIYFALLFVQTILLRIENNNDNDGDGSNEDNNIDDIDSEDIESEDSNNGDSNNCDNNDKTN